MLEIEHQVQKSIIQYLDLRRICHWAVPNGGMRNVKVAAKLKAEGVRSGVPDITLIHKGRYYGLEVKKPKTNTPAGVLSKAQKQRIKQIEDAGGLVAVVHSVDEVYHQLKEWGIG